MNILELKDVTFSTNKHYNNLQNINISLKELEKALFFAGDDSGIIEMFRVILGFEKKFQGEILYNGQDIRRVKYQGTKILYIPKNPVFFENKSLEYNIKYFLRLRERKKDKVNRLYQEIVRNYGFEGLEVKKVQELDEFSRVKLAFVRSTFRELDLILIEDVFSAFSIDVQVEIAKFIKTFINEHNSAVIVWSQNAELKRIFDDFKLYTLEYGTLSC